MSAPQFGHLAKFNPKANAVDFYPAIPPQLRSAPTVEEPEGELIVPTISLRNAGQANKPYFNAVSKQNAKSGQARRLAQGRIDAETVDRNRRQDRLLFPRHVIVGWSGIYDEKGLEVEYSLENCAAFLNALPDWMMDELRNFAAVPSNFLDDDEPDDEDIAETAKN
tara:strand:+ start:22691 stop:23188 length:498 start_codon:yes stop_codon:yes gene_type:complete